MPFKPNTAEFNQYVQRILSKISMQQGMFFTGSDLYDQMNLLGGALSEFGAELRKESDYEADGVKMEAIAKAISTLQNIQNTRASSAEATVRQALETLQGLSDLLDEHYQALMNFSARQVKNVRDAIEQGLPLLSNELELNLGLEEEAEAEQDVQERENNENVIENNNPPEQINQENNNIIIENENPPEQINQENNNIFNENNNNIINENVNENAQPNQNEQNGPIQQEIPPVAEDIPEQQQVPVPPAVAPLRGEALEQPANRLKAHFLGVANGLPNNVSVNSLTGKMRQQLPQFANAIATLGTEGQSAEAYQQAKNKLQEFKPLMLQLGSTGNLGFEFLTNKCNKIPGGSPNEQSLKADLQSINVALNLGLGNLDQELDQKRLQRGRKVEELRRVSNPIGQDPLNSIPENPDERTALQHLNALYAALSAYDQTHEPRFTQLREHLNTVRQCIAGLEEPKKGTNILRNGSMAQALQDASALLQDDDQTITEGIDKAAVRGLLQRAAAAMHIHPENLVPEEIYNQVQSAENHYLAQRTELENQQLQAQQEQQRLTRIQNERFNIDLNAPTQLGRALYNAADRITHQLFQQRSIESKKNAVIGLFSLAQTMLESPADAAEQNLDPVVVKRNANRLAENPTFTILAFQNIDQLRQVVSLKGVSGAIEFLQNRMLAMEDLPETLPDVFLPEAIDLTHNRIERAKTEEFRNLPPAGKVHTLAQILAAREVVGSTPGKKNTLQRHLDKKFFARTRELEQSETFRRFVELNEAQINRSLQGRTHGGNMEKLFKSYVRTRPHLPDDIPSRFMPTALERIEDLQNLIKSNRFRNFAPAVKENIYAELMATRLAVNSVRNHKSSLNFSLNGEALAKAREQIMSDPDMRLALRDAEINEAARTGHGGGMEDIAARYNCKDTLKENMPPRYQPTVKQWIQHQLNTLTSNDIGVTDLQREQAAARIFVALEAFGNDLNVRIGEKGPSASELNTRSTELASDQAYKSLCAMGGLAQGYQLVGTRNPLRVLTNTFQQALNATENKPLGGSFTRLSPAQPPRPRNDQPAPNDVIDPEAHFQKVKRLMTKYNGPDLNYWRTLNARTVKRALAEVSACAVLQGRNEPVNVQNLQTVSTKLMESKEWLTYFGQKNVQELQQILVGAENREAAVQQIRDDVQAAQQPVAPQIQPQAQQLDHDANPQGIQPGLQQNA